LIAFAGYSGDVSESQDRLDLEMDKMKLIRAKILILMLAMGLWSSGPVALSADRLLVYVGAASKPPVVFSLGRSSDLRPESFTEPEGYISLSPAFVVS
jgi:hypothetical protein